MALYHVVSGSVYKNWGMLRIDVVESGDNDWGLYEVEGHPERQVQLQVSRIRWNERNEIDGRVWVITPPDFPIQELVGKDLIGLPREVAYSTE